MGGSFYMIDLPAGVKRGEISQQRIAYWWSRLKGFDKLFTDSLYLDEHAFYLNCLDPDNEVFETEGGLIAFDHIQEGLKARGHLSFWDHKLSAKKELFKDVLIWMFITHDLFRIEAVIPENARVLRHFLTRRMGFRLEGTLRDDWWKDGQLINRHILSILRSEVSDGR
jgi:hypothetical protein